MPACHEEYCGHIRNLKNNVGELQKKLNLLRKVTTELTQANTTKKVQIRTTSAFVTKLLEAGRVTKEELAAVFKPKKEVV